jgi:hypothetical protein
MTKIKHVTKNLGDGEYSYRGIKIRRNDDTPQGYWGRWEVRGLKIGTVFNHKHSSMAVCKSVIDRELDKGE